MVKRKKPFPIILVYSNRCEYYKKVKEMNIIRLCKVNIFSLIFYFLLNSQFTDFYTHPISIHSNGCAFSVGLVIAYKSCDQLNEIKLPDVPYSFSDITYCLNGLKRLDERSLFKFNFFFSFFSHRYKGAK